MQDVQGHDGLNLPHDLLVALLLDSPDEHHEEDALSRLDCKKIQLREKQNYIL